jgi:hypothetical protein
MNSFLKENNYLVIPNFINYSRAKNLAEEFKNFVSNNNISGDDQVPLSSSNYNYISFLELLCEKTPEVSKQLEETVLPTYVYSRIYKNQSILNSHVDRDACEISLTLHLGGDASWPIWIETPQGEKRSIQLNPGDAMMYLGCKASHWREEYAGEWYAQAFLHYVRSRGEKSYAYFDKTDQENCTESNDLKTTVNVSETPIETCSNKISPVLIVPKPETKLEDFIHVFDNVLPKNICEDILKEYKNSEDWNFAATAVGVNLDMRNCRQILTSDSGILSKNLEVRTNLDEQIYQGVKTAGIKYAEIHQNFNISIDTGYSLLEYTEGQFYVQHTDSFKEQQRSVSCSIQLNDDYIGGEFAFMDRSIMIRALPGSAIMFPSNFMYPHEIMPVKKGTRYSIITWLV